MTKDEKYISRCLQLAYNGLCNTAPNPMVGAVIVYQDVYKRQAYAPNHKPNEEGIAICK